MFDKKIAHDSDERGLTIPSGNFVDLSVHEFGCSLVRAVAGSNGRGGGGVEIGKGSWGSMHHLFLDCRKKNDGYEYHIGIPDGSWFPVDYIEKYTFVEAVRLGLAKLEDVHDWVGSWHAGQAGQDYVSLRQHLGIQLGAIRRLGEGRRRFDGTYGDINGNEENFGLVYAGLHRNSDGVLRGLVLSTRSRWWRSWRRPCQCGPCKYRTCIYRTSKQHRPCE